MPYSRFFSTAQHSAIVRKVPFVVAPQQSHYANFASTKLYLFFVTCKYLGNFFSIYDTLAEKNYQKCQNGR